jgi:hypothetical protein
MVASLTSDTGLVERFIVLALRLGRHVDGFVDAYHGPAELEPLAVGDLRTPARLAADAEELLLDLDEDRSLELSRRAWIHAQVRACSVVARRVAGQEMSWADEVEACFGVRPSTVPERELERAHSILDDALPSDGALADRYRTWVEGQLVEPGSLVAAADRLARVFRERVADIVTLPTGETATFELTDDVPWSAYHYYDGDCASRVAINAGSPVWAPWLTDLVGHELYPGHHTERACKEEALIRRRGYVEEALTLTLAPQSLVAEGIAMLGHEVVLGDDRHRVAAEALRPLGIRYDHEVAAVVDEADRILEAAIVNVARRVHEDGASLDEARRYLMRWRLRPPESIDRSVAFVMDPTWRTYVSTYVDGLRICREFVGGDKRRFVRLLTEQLTPHDLLAGG